MKDTITLTLAVIGALVIILIILFCIMGAISDASDEKRVRQYYAKGREVADRLDIAYWFSADPHVYNALYLLHYQLKEYGYVDASRIRDFVKECGDKTCKELKKQTI